MALYEKAKDVFIQRKTSNNKFEEYPLIVQPNSVIITDAANNLVMKDSSEFLGGTGTIENAISSSYALNATNANNAISSSYSTTASFALNGGGSSITTGSTYPITASIALTSVSASYLSGSTAIVGNTILGQNIVSTGRITGVQLKTIFGEIGGDYGSYGGVYLPKDSIISFTSTTSPATTADLGLQRRSANTLEVNNGTLGQVANLVANVVSASAFSSSGDIKSSTNIRGQTITSDNDITITAGNLNVASPYSVKLGNASLSAFNANRLDILNNAGTAYADISCSAVSCSGVLSTGIISSNMDYGELRSYQSKGGDYLSLKTIPGKSGLFRSNTDHIIYYNTNTGDTILDATFGGSSIGFNVLGVEKMKLLNGGNFVVSSSVTASAMQATRFIGTASYATTASYALNGGGSTLSTGSTYPITSSWAINTFSQSADLTIQWIPTGSIPLGVIGFATTSSTDFVIAQQSSSVGGISLQTSGSQRIYITTTGEIQFTGSVLGVASSSYALTASYALNGGGTPATYTSSLYGTASWAVTASYAIGSSGVTDGGSYNISASWASASISASYAPGATPATYTSSLYGTSSWANNAVSASYALTASYAATSLSSTTDTLMYWVPTGSIAKGVIGFYNTSSTDFVIAQQSSSTGGISLNTSGSQRIYISSSGNVGIGTNNPTYKLTVDGTIDSTNMICITAAVGNLYPIGIYEYSNGVDLPFKDGSGNELMRLSHSGSLSIGVISSSAKLHVQGNISASSVTASLFGSSSYAISASYAPSTPSTSANNFAIAMAIAL